MRIPNFWFGQKIQRKREHSLRLEAVDTSTGLVLSLPWSQVLPEGKERWEHSAWTTVGFSYRLFTVSPFLASSRPRPFCSSQRPCHGECPSGNPLQIGRAGGMDDPEMKPVKVKSSLQVSLLLFSPKAWISAVPGAISVEALPLLVFFGGFLPRV